ncbi:phage major capsid protein [Paraburkholderia saeva]|uniref:phage major capsid protein n=1 Tax=Paraburkholderia saeva TaxID=2777537 RepID=UPI001D4AF561|nr:phage major capsid protein [Paraburkholderia saeva]CAG4926189.1 hypothetical protein R70241_05447 [Paraburkholderia saeva]
MDLTEIKKALDETFNPIKERLTKLEANTIDLGQKLAGRTEGLSGVVGEGYRETLGALAAKSLWEKWEGGNGATRVKVSLNDVSTKAVLSSQADPANGYPVAPQQQVVTPIILPHFWSSLSSVPVTSNAIEVVKADFTNNAAVVAEAALKPESTNGFSSELSPVVTVATWKLASRQVLDDVPQLQGFINTELRDAVNQTVDTQVLSGSGIGGNLTGLMTGGTQVDGAAGDNRLDTLLGAVASLQAMGATRVVVGLNPVDLIAMATMKGSDGQYMLNPLAPLTGILGASFVPSAGVPAGQYVACATPQGAYVGLRQGITVEVSREDRDNFVKNMVTMLSEMRLALVIQRPELVFYGALVEPVAPGGESARSKASKS